MASMGDLGAELNQLMVAKEALEVELEEKKTTLKDCTKQLQESQESAAFLDAEFKRLEGTNGLLEERVADLEEQKEAGAREAAEKLQEVQAEQRKEVAEMTKAHHLALSESTEELNKAKREIERVEKELAQATEEIVNNTTFREEITKTVSEKETELGRLKHEKEQMNSKYEQKKEQQKELKDERDKMHEKYLQERKTSETATAECQELRATNERTKEEVKRLVDENTALNIKVQTEMASLAFWLQDHKDLTAEMEEERAMHKTKVSKLEERLADQEAQLHTAWEEKREATQHAKETGRALRHKEKELQRRKEHEEKMGADNGELRNKMEVQSKLLTVQSQRMQELEKTARAAEEMVMAWKKHAEVIQMEKDEAVSIARTAQEAATIKNVTGGASNKMVRGISRPTPGSGSPGAGNATKPPST